MMVDDPAQDHGEGHPERRDRDRDKSCPVEYLRQQHPEYREAGDPNDRGDEP